MKTTQINRWAILAMVLGITATASAEQLFRGLVKDQGNNLLFSDSLDRWDDLNKPFYMDVTDDFARDGMLHDSEADGLQIGFVPPYEGVPDGPLTGDAADTHGRWQTLHGSLQTNAADSGFVQSTAMLDRSVAALPWRVESGLGDYYHIEMTAKVAAGEKVSLGYFGDIDTLDATQGLAGELGQLVLGLERGIGQNDDNIVWTVSWVEGETKRSFSSSTTAPVDEELNLQLGWLDQGTDDLFDAWLGTSTTNARLINGNMNTALDIYAVGFDVSGANSQIGGFTSAVPEPTSGLLGLLGLMLALVGRRRN